MQTCDYCSGRTPLIRRVTCARQHVTNHCSSCQKTPCKSCQSGFRHTCDFCKKNLQYNVMSCGLHYVCSTCASNCSLVSCSICLKSSRNCQSCNEYTNTTSACSKHFICKSCYQQEKACPKCPQSTSSQGLKCSRCLGDSKETYKPFNCSHTYCLLCSAKLLDSIKKCYKCSAAVNSQNNRSLLAECEKKSEMCEGCKEYMLKSNQETSTCQKCKEVTCRIHRSLLKDCGCGHKRLGKSTIDVGQSSKIKERARQQIGTKKDTVGMICEQCGSIVQRLVGQRCSYCVLLE